MAPGVLRVSSPHGSAYGRISACYLVGNVLSKNSKADLVGSLPVAFSAAIMCRMLHSMNIEDLMLYLDRRVCPLTSAMLLSSAITGVLEYFRSISLPIAFPGYNPPSSRCLLYLRSHDLGVRPLPKWSASLTWINSLNRLDL